MIFHLTDSEFLELTAFVKINFGLDLAQKRTFVEMRVQRLMMESGYTDFAAYFHYVCNDISGIAISSFISGLTVNYTHFNREAFHFEFLASQALPELIVKENNSRDLRIWSAGCSSGEEPYTLAIILADLLGPGRSQWDTKILATDISSYALKKAILGEYPAQSIEDLNKDWVSKYFIQSPNDPEKVMVAPSIRDEVIFRKFNLVKDPFQFKQKFHIIFCRNVMIYFDEATKNHLIRKFATLLHDGGYLFIGLSETMDHHTPGLEYIMPSIYQKK